MGIIVLHFEKSMLWLNIPHCQTLQYTIHRCYNGLNNNKLRNFFLLRMWLVYDGTATCNANTILLTII